MTPAPLARLARLKAEHDKLLDRLVALDRRRHAAIVAELDAGASLTAIAAELGISRQALSKYLDRRETPNA